MNELRKEFKSDLLHVSEDVHRVAEFKKISRIKE
jgi:hypothetical protein